MKALRYTGGFIAFYGLMDIVVAPPSPNANAFLVGAVAWFCGRIGDWWLYGSSIVPTKKGWKLIQLMGGVILFYGFASFLKSYSGTAGTHSAAAEEAGRGIGYGSLVWLFGRVGAWWFRD